MRYPVAAGNPWSARRTSSTGSSFTSDRIFTAARVRRATVSLRIRCSAGGVNR
jgi:hypothetical protein